MRQLLLAAVLVLTSGAVYAQGTPDGETPANEGVCDDLMFATPGLYGLCVAYCEAMDCDFSVEGEPPCKNAGPKILENYNRKMRAGDPPMPCLLAPPDECPCFSLDEALALPEGPETVDCHLEPGFRFLWGEASAGFWHHPDGAALILISRDYGNCFYYDDARNIWRVKYFSDIDEGELDEAWACFDILWQACLQREDCYLTTHPSYCPNYPVP